MTAAPAFRIDLRRHGVWRFGVAATVLAAMGAIGSWAGTSSQYSATPRWSLAVLCAIGAGWVGVSLWRQSVASLAWDGQRWHLRETSGEPDAGALAVAIDLGGWMLLRFERTAPTGRQRVTWIPVQRRGLEAQWHLLRCAVYSPRPEHGTEDAADPRPPA